MPHPDQHRSRGTLRTAAPFHLEATVRVLQRRPTNLVDQWQAGTYLRVLRTPERLTLVAVENQGTIDQPDLRYCVRHPDPSSTTHRLVRTLRWVLGLDVDPVPFLRVAEAEHRLLPMVLALRGMRPPRFTGLFEAFANVVPFQQVSLDAGVSIVARVVANFGEYVEQGGRRFHAFPTAEAIADARLDALRRCGLSSRKAESLRHLARMVAAGELTERKISAMSTRDALALLGELPGIGPWSASLVLLRGFGRLDVFPPGDVGVVRGLSRLLGLSAGLSLARTIERFGDQRGYLYFYSLGAYLLNKGLIATAAPRQDRHA